MRAAQMRCDRKRTSSSRLAVAQSCLCRYEACAERAESSDLREACGLEDSFATRFNLLTLHIWMSLVKLRQEGEWGEKVSQILYDTWLEDMEAKLVEQDFKCG